MPLSERENYLRTVEMTNPEWIPCRVHVNDASWDELRQELEQVALRHPKFFPHVKKGWRDYENYEFAPGHRAREPFTDAWECVWLSDRNGIEGVVVESPLDDWDKLPNYHLPNPMVQSDREPADWQAERFRLEKARAENRLTSGGVPHGFFFLRLCYLRGFENFMIDVATEEPRLNQLIESLVQHNQIIVNQYLSIGIDIFEFGDDLGTQTASILSPAQFKKWILPGYKRLMQPCREAGIHIGLHSDGYIMDLMGDFIEAGVTIINPQDLCNGIDALAREVKGRMCIRLDIDRQSIVPYGSRAEIRELIEEEIRKLGSPKGGLEMLVGIYPPTPPENVDALCCAFEEFERYFWK